MMRAFLVLAILTIVAAACVRAGPARSSVPLKASGVTNAQSAPKAQETKGGDEEAFRTLALKMDEYQDLMATCNSLAQTEENREIRGSCDARLKALREELSDLTDRLQVQPK
jgi:hypothetical protein